MKPILKYALLIFWFCPPLLAQDLPNPSPNLENIVAGSFIIPMDNAHQGYPSTNGSEIYFNNRAYGLVYHLLEQGISIKWAIRSGKQKDEADFNALSRQILPTTSSFSNENFAGSAFIIPLQSLSNQICQGDDFLPQPILTELINQSNLNDVNIYELGEDAVIDIRYTLSHPPQIGVLIDGTIDDHQPILSQAGIPFTELNTTNFIQDYACFSYISQSHIKLAQVTPQYADGVEAFIESGGNFFAQCEATKSYETLTNLMTTMGINSTTTYTNTALVYTNNDMPIMQFIGSAELSLGGVTEFFLPPGSQFHNYTYPCIQRASGNQLMRAADVNGAIIGGNLFYAGGHEYSGEPTSVSHSNNQRIYLNSLFIPASGNYACAGQSICICEGESIELGCTTTETEGFYWSPTNGLSCTDCPNPTASPTETTTYFVSKSGSVCPAASVEINVSHNNIEIQNLTKACLNENSYIVNFNVESLTGEAFNITGNNGSLTGNLFTSNTILSGDNFYFEIAIADKCPKILQGRLDCSCNISAQISGTDTLCLNGNNSTTIPINLSGNPPWQLSYTIDNEPQPSIEINTSPYQLTVNQVGTYQITQLSNNDDCWATIGGTVNIVGETPPNADNIEIEVCDTSTAFQIFDFIDAATTGQWQLLNNTTLDNPLDTTTGIFTPNNDWAGETLNYQYELTSNKCPSSFSQISITVQACKKEDTITSPPPIDEIVLIPNAFSPNNDGVNDLLQIIPLTDISQIQLNIFNRWGQHIHSGTNWNGTYKGETCNIGVYLYQIKIELANGEIVDAAGHLTLVK